MTQREEPEFHSLHTAVWCGGRGAEKEISGLKPGELIGNQIPLHQHEVSDCPADHLHGKECLSPAEMIPNEFFATGPAPVDRAGLLMFGDG